MEFLSDEQVRGLLTPRDAVAAVLEGLRQQAGDAVRLSDPRSLRTEITREENTHFQVKGAYLADAGIAGFRLAGIRDETSVDEGRLLLLFDVTSLLPLALLKERTVYQLRVGAEIAVTIEALRARAGRLAMLGSGRLARSTLLVTQELYPFEEVAVYSRTADRREGLVRELAGRVPGALIAETSLERACAGADVVVTLTNATSPVLDAAVCGPGSLVVTAGSGQECAPGVFRQADRLIIDDWEQCVTLGDVAALVDAGALDRDDVDARLCDVVVGAVPGRTADDERVVAVPQGLTFLDLAVGRRLLGRASRE